MTIYNSTKVLPYVYQLTHKETGQFYIGVRYANKTPSTDDLGYDYFTSSKYVKDLGFDNFNITIIAEFFEKFHALDFEQFLIKENWNNTLILNKNANGKLFSNNTSISEKTKQKISNTAIANGKLKGRIVSLEARKKISEFQKTRIHKPVSEETKQKISKANTGKTKTIEAKQRMSKAKSGIIFSEDHKQKISKAGLGRKASEETKAKMKATWERKRQIKIICQLP